MRVRAAEAAEAAISERAKGADPDSGIPDTRTSPNDPLRFGDGRCRLSRGALDAAPVGLP